MYSVPFVEVFGLGISSKIFQVSESISRLVSRESRYLAICRNQVALNVLDHISMRGTPDVNEDRLPHCSCKDVVLSTYPCIAIHSTSSTSSF